MLRVDDVSGLRYSVRLFTHLLVYGCCRSTEQAVWRCLQQAGLLEQDDSQGTGNDSTAQYSR